MSFVSVWLLSLVLCWGLPSPHTTLSSAAVYYVTPHSPNPDCPSGEPCLTINEYAQGNHFDGDDNITLLFLNGEHKLTVQDFEIDNKSSLKMAPRHEKGERIIQQVNTSILARNLSEVKFEELKFIGTDDTTPACISVLNVGLLSVARVSIKSCQLLLHDGEEINITELTASESHVYLHSNQTNQNIAIRNSKFHSTTFSVSDNSTGSNIFSLESSFLNNSLIAVTLQGETVYKLSIIDTTVTSHNKSNSLKTGIEVDTYNTAVLHACVKRCSITGNQKGIAVTVHDYSVLDLNIDQCYIAHNGYANNTHPGGIAVRHSGDEFHINSTISISILSTTLLENQNIQIDVDTETGLGNFVTMYNCTIKNTQTSPIYPERSGVSLNIGGGLDLGCFPRFANLTHNVFEDDIIAVAIAVSGTCVYEVHFVDNTVTDLKNSTRTVFGGLTLSSMSWGIVNIADSHFTRKSPALLMDGLSALVTISQIVIEQNKQNGLILSGLNENSTLIISNSLFQDNKGISLGVTNLEPDKPKILFNVFLKNVTFFKNSIILPDTGIVQVDRSTRLYIEDSCVFRENQGSVIQALATNVTFSGVIIFEGNVAFQGGAISMSYSMLRFKSVNRKNTNIVFRNNKATSTGGSIEVYRSMHIDNNAGSRCFYDKIQGISYEDLINSTVNITLEFVNNTATNGGFDIYGGTPRSGCLINFNDTTYSYLSSKIQSYVFKTSSKLSAISSDPKRVCLCDTSSQLVCANLSYIFYNTTRYPGEEFSLSLAVVGLDFGTVTGIMYASFLSQRNNSMSCLDKDQLVRQVNLNGCNRLNFTVNSLNSRETIVLTVNNTAITKADSYSYVKSVIDFHNNHLGWIPFSLLTVPVYIEVTLAECPPGFQLTDKGKCDCAPELEHIGVRDCVIYNNTPYITRSENQWIQVAETNGTISSKYCPFNYCNQTVINLNLSNPDEQCALGHSGILCGACPSNLSLAIGSSRCLECSDNNHIALLIAFAAAGVLLVLFIKMLDLTVTKGTINGLIFYANIIWANQSVLFPPQEQTSPLLQFLKVFIAWLNLDFGIETCFIQGLNGYWKTWLQFVFPAYIWLIAGLIILVSHYSIRATRIFGNNSVSVLATLLFLSYTKLLRTILIILEFSLLQYPDRHTRAKWSFDGNIPYFGLEHSILFIVAIGTLLVLWVPYTTSLFSIQFLRRYSHKRFLRWVNKLKPLFDSYLGPLKVKHHYWIGLGLLARLVLLLISAITLTTAPSIAAVAITVVASLLCLSVVSVYKQWQLGALEGCFLVNTAMFSCGALEGSKDGVACISLGITFLLFLAIVGYHMFKRIKSLVLKKVQNPQGGYEDIDAIQTALRSRSPNQPVSYQEVKVSVSDLREPLLEATN